MAETTASQDALNKMLFEYIDHGREQDRQERLRRETIEAKEKRRARRPTYIKCALGFFFGLLIFAWSINVFLTTKDRWDRVMNTVTTVAYTTFANTVWEGETAMLIVPIQGEISGHPLEVSQNVGVMSMFSSQSNTVFTVRRALQDASALKSLSELVVYVESPGGGVAPAEEVYSLLKEWRKGHPSVRVSAYFYDKAASGGYYAAMAADKLIAGESTLVGSISVIMQMPDLSKIAERWGFSMNTIKSGKIKDVGNMFTPMPDEARAVLVQLVQGMHQRFLEVVSAGRPKLTVERIEELADGRILTSRDALAAGLIDRIVPTFDAYLAERAKAIMEENKVGRVQILYPGSVVRASHVEIKPQQ